MSEVFTRGRIEAYKTHDAQETHNIHETTPKVLYTVQNIGSGKELSADRAGSCRCA